MSCSPSPFLFCYFLLLLLLRHSILSSSAKCIYKYNKKRQTRARKCARCATCTDKQRVPAVIVGYTRRGERERERKKISEKRNTYVRMILSSFFIDEIILISNRRRKRRKMRSSRKRYLHAQLHYISVVFVSENSCQNAKMRERERKKRQPNLSYCTIISGKRKKESSLRILLDDHSVCQLLFGTFLPHIINCRPVRQTPTRDNLVDLKQLRR